MKKITAFTAGSFRRLTILLTFLLATLLLYQPATAQPLSESSNPVTAAALKLVAFNNDSRSALDVQSVKTLVDYVLGSKSGKEVTLPQIQNTTGAYYEYDTKIGFPDFLQYSFSGQIPLVITSPASLRYSQWSSLQGKSRKLPGRWKPLAHDGKPVIIRGTQRDGITPDQTTGVYYEYDLKRTLILLHFNEQQVLVSISKQMNISDVGKKGFILGNDDDWNYYYSGETGSAQAGLGWVKSYIYDYFSVAVYTESSSSPATVRAGIFQWIRAGWSGINFVQTEHIIKGMKRHSKNLKSILESPNLPPPEQIAATYQWLSSLPQNELVAKYTALQQARLVLAVTSGKIKSPETKKPNALAHPPKEQIIDALMLEYLKIALGKPSLINKQIVLGMN